MSMTMGVVGGSGDKSVPTLTSATIGADGTTWTFVFNEKVDFGAGGNAGWAVTMTSAGAVTLTYASGSGSTSLVYTGDVLVYSGDTVSAGLDYTQPGNGIEDAAHNDLASIDDASVTNSSAQVWTPVLLTSVKLWVKSDTGVTASGDPLLVTGWADQSGVAGGNDLTDSGIVNVAYETNILNGKQGLKFDSGRLFMDTVTGFATGNGTMSFGCVVKTGTVAAGSGIFGAGDGNGLSTFGLYVGISAGLISMEFNGGNGYRPDTGATLSNSTAYYIYGTKAAGAINTTTKLYLNGTECTGGSHSSETPNFAYTPASANCTVGQWPGSNVFGGYIFELVIGAATWSAAELTKLQTYFKARYGL